MQSHIGTLDVSPLPARRRHPRSAINAGALATLITLAAAGVIGLVEPSIAQDLCVAAAALVAVAAGVYRLTTHTRLPLVLTPAEPLNGPATPETLPQSAPPQVPQRARIQYGPSLGKNQSAA